MQGTPRLLLTSISGWLLVVFLATTIRLAYRWRPAATGPLAGGSRMRFHYWLGYGIAALAIVHSGFTMTPGLAGAAHRVGIRLASLALLVALIEVGIGLTLRRRGRSREVLRRAHSWAMITLTALVAVHIALDSAALGTFKPRPGPAASARGAGPDRPVGVSSK